MHVHVRMKHIVFIILVPLTHVFDVHVSAAVFSPGQSSAYTVQVFVCSSSAYMWSVNVNWQVVVTTVASHLITVQ